MQKKSDAMETLYSSEHLSKNVAQQLIITASPNEREIKHYINHMLQCKRVWYFPSRKEARRVMNQWLDEETQETDASQISKSCS